MKKTILLTIAASAAAAAAYLMVRNCGCNQENEALSEVKKERHLTNAFSKAKQQAVTESE